MSGRFKYVSEIQQANRRAGFHFFDADTMRFFKSKIASWEVWDGRYFITSEKFECGEHSEPREYTIREAQDDGSVDTVGEFGQYGTLARAKAGIRRLLIQEIDRTEEAQRSG